MKPQRSQSICLINFVKVTYSPTIVPTSEKCYACNILRNTTYVPIKLFLQCHLWNLTDVMTTCAVYFSFTSDVGKDYNVHQHFMIDKQLYTLNNTVTCCQTTLLNNQDGIAIAWRR